MPKNYMKKIASSKDLILDIHFFFLQIFSTLNDLTPE